MLRCLATLRCQIRIANESTVNHVFDSCVQMQGLLQENRAEQAGVYVRGGGRMRDHEGAEEQVSVLQVQEVHRTGDGPAGGSGRPNARREKFRRGVQSLQSTHIKF